jgi:hypothetical protein
MARNAEYVSRFVARLKQWDEDWKALKALGTKAGEPRHAAFEAHMQGLRASRDKAMVAYDEIRFGAESSSARLQAAMDVSWNAMTKALERAKGDLVR